MFSTEKKGNLRCSYTLKAYKLLYPLLCSSALQYWVHWNVKLDILSISPKPGQRERKNGGRRVCSSHIVMCYCAILPDPLQESPGWKEGEEEEVEQEEDTFTGQRENTSTATVWTQLCNTHTNFDTLMSQLKNITDGCQLKTTWGD